MSPKEAAEHTERAAHGAICAVQSGLGPLADEIIRLRQVIEVKNEAIDQLLLSVDELWEAEHPLTLDAAKAALELK